MAKKTTKKTTGTAPDEDNEPVPEPDAETQDALKKMGAALNDANRKIMSLTKERDAAAAANARMAAAPAPKSADPTIEIMSADGLYHTIKGDCTEVKKWWDTYLQPGQGRHERNIMDVK